MMRDAVEICIWTLLLLLAASVFAAHAHAGSFASRAEGAPAGRPMAGPQSRPGVMLVHDAVPTTAQPKGWTYPFSCCSGFDCREVKASAIGEKQAGYVIKGTGEILAYGDTRLKDSPDGAFHWCSVAGLDDSRTICLFVPPRGF